MSSAFEKAKSFNQLEECYHLLAMTQVLTVPPSKTAERERFWTRAPNFIFVLPPLMQLLVCVNDARTIDLAWLLSPTDTLISFVCAFVFFVLLVIFSFLCIGLSLNIDRVWQKQAKELGIDAR